MRSSFTKYDSRGMIIALAATTVIHLSLAAGVIWGGWLEAGATGLPSKPREVLVLVNLSASVQEAAKIEKKNTFVPVDPKIASPEPPRESTTLYSNANSRAAQEQPAPAKQSQPFIDGQNDLFPGSFNHPPSTLNPVPTAAQAPAAPATPTLPPVDLQPQKTTRNPAAKVPVVPGSAPPRKDELTALNHLLKPADVLGKPIPLETETALPGSSRAPTLAEAKRRLEAGMQASRKMKPGGGVTRMGPPSLSVRLTGYGEYDARFVDEVRLAWLRYRAKPGWFHPGTVVIDFKLHHTGAITGLVVRESSAKPLHAYYCRQALEIPAPFARWSDTMRREIGADFRRCRFSFHYLHR
jgi:hypothetical protein